MPRGKPLKVQRHGRTRWEVTETDPSTGRRISRRFFPTLHAAQEYQDGLNRQEPPSGTLHPAFDPEATLRGYSEDRFLPSHKGTWKPRAYDLNAYTLSRYILPFPIGGGGQTLGDVKVRDFRRGYAKALIEHYRDTATRPKGGAPFKRGTISIIYRTLRGVLSAAVDDELIETNPVLRLGKLCHRPGDNKDPDPKAMTFEQLHRFLTAAKEAAPALYPLFMALAYGGLRNGEATGWQLGDLHLDTREANVCRSLGQDASMVDPTPTLTKTGKARTIDLCDALHAVLTRIAEARKGLALARRWRPVPPWVFVTSNGTPYSQHNVMTTMKRVLKRAGLPGRFSPHALRHTYATLHLVNGANPLWVSQQLGHQSSAFTERVYGSWLRKRDTEGAGNRLTGRVGSVVPGS